MKDLNRIQVGDFNINKSIKIDELKNSNMDNFISIEEFFSLNNKVMLNSTDLKHFFNGVKMSRDLKDGLYRIYNINNDFIGIGVVEDRKLKRDIIL